MKKKLFYLFIIFVSISFGQTLENTYTTSGYIEPEPNYSFIVNSTINYYTLDWINNQIKLYDSSHNLFKSITITLENGFEMKQLHLPTDKLFNADSKIEFMIESRQTASPYQTNFKVFNEDGNNIFTFSNVSNYKLSKNPNNEYKLITSESTLNSDEVIYKVYSLSGILSINQEHILNKSIFQFPNPTFETFNLRNLKNNGKENILEIFSIQGKKVISKKIGQNKNEISVNVSHLSKGIYIYKIGELSNKFVKE
ncbi:T9SS type A sorting domain-containing protein [uncultured Polaribacter sp.]|uniref:T9SS type A sorting domain-containing protein n=1 Tax=uncultured Polaribacter sp. TaxID=174711 RepID=UPI00261EDEC2|nr:T9SS type A sorting domain-containing protein [uncultured Polaribacter sp.]